MAHYWYSCGVPQQRQTDRQTEQWGGLNEEPIETSRPPTHLVLMMSEMCRWPVATSSRPHLHTSNRLLLYITPASYWTVGFLHQSLSLAMIHRWYMAARPLSERSADSGRRWKDSTTTTHTTNPTCPSASSPIDMWRRKSLIFVQRQCSALLCLWHRLTCPVVHDQL